MRRVLPSFVIELQAKLLGGLVVPAVMTSELSYDSCSFGSLGVELAGDVVYGALDIGHTALQVMDMTVYFGEAFIKVFEECCPKAGELFIKFGVDIVVSHNCVSV